MKTQSENVTIEHIDAAAEAVRERINQQPAIGMILGSGLGGLADSVENAEIVPFGELPHWPISTVHGHSGRLVVGELESQPVLVMQGRVHYYEGYEMPWATFPVRVMRRIGIKSLVVTNAAGAVNPDYEPGDLMMLTDHLNLIGMAGPNPLRGPNLDEFGVRFPDMSRVYDRHYHAHARAAALDAGVTLHEGVYVSLAGPSFETPADLRFLRMVGVDAVGMSTVPEAIVARHSGMRVLGISGISNKANLDGETETTHEEVMEAGRILVPRLEAVVRRFLQRLG
jgi:purine-nucleoside phosphorylase